MTQLPDWLRDEQPDDTAERLAERLGTGAVPYLSIEGNRFQWIESSGNSEYVGTSDPKLGPYVDLVIVDSSDVTCKIYYGPDNKYDPKNPTPPMCFSSNGVAPSRAAGFPQSPTCGDCRQNVRGSATSAMSGKPVKACRDYEFLAVMPPSSPDVDDMAFLLRVPPNSRTNLRNYVAKFAGQPVGFKAVVTRVSFQPGVQGTLVFQAVSYIDAATKAGRDKIRASKVTDTLVGRTDVPREGALPAPAQHAQIAAQPASPPPHQPQIPQQGFQPAPFVSASSAAPPASTPTTASGPATPATEPTGRRKRRTKAEMEAARSQPPAAPAGPVAGTPAPFLPQPAATQANGPAPSFGMAQGVAPDPALNAELDNLFGPVT